MAPTPGDTDIGRAIGIARVLCILGVVYVHAWTGRTAEELETLSSTTQGVLRWGLIELVGRSAVPLLGAISGWLAGPSAAKRGYGGFVRVKARTVLAPMLLWNAIALALVSGAAAWGTLKAPVPTSIGEALDWIGCITQANPINVQISFLRDLFLCMTLAPLLARAGDRVLMGIWLAAILWSVSGLELHVLLRPAILVFFVTGMLARRRGWAEWIAAWPLWATLMPYLLLVPVKIWLSSVDQSWLEAHVGVANAIDLPIRFAAALAIWRIASALSIGRIGRTIVPGERYAFLLFCSHLILIWLIGPLLGLLTGPLGAPLYTPFLLLQPLLVLGPTILLGRGLEAASRPLAGLLSGGRLAMPRPLPRRRASAMERSTSAMQPPAPGAIP